LNQELMKYCLDAEECWSQMVNAIRPQVPGLADSSGSAAKSFVEQYLMGEMRTVYVLFHVSQDRTNLGYLD
jgi:cbb3-type cytochrome oxidase cytochrome c subunit